MHPLQHKRAVLLAAIKELTSLAEEKDRTTDERVGLVAEATRLSVRLLKVQIEIEEHDLD